MMKILMPILAALSLSGCIYSEAPFFSGDAGISGRLLPGTYEACSKTWDADTSEWKHDGCTSQKLVRLSGARYEITGKSGMGMPLVLHPLAGPLVLVQVNVGPDQFVYGMATIEQRVNTRFAAFFPSCKFGPALAEAVRSTVGLYAKENSEHCNVGNISAETLVKLFGLLGRRNDWVTEFVHEYRRTGD